MSNNDTVVQEIAGPTNGITAEKIEAEINKRQLTPVRDGGKSFSGKESITVEGFDFTTNKGGEKQLAITDCEDVTIRYCKFRNKSTLGQGLNVTGAKTKRVVIEYCLFENFTYKESNGGEPCRLGNSQFSGCIFECIVRNCIFRNLTSDPEAISIKSCNNLIENNFFINNKSNVCVRHGGLTTVRHNFFTGTNGVRLHGYGNKVEYNCFANNSNEEDLAPVTVRWGNTGTDPNWDDYNKPSGESGASHAAYAQNIQNLVQNNEFKNCRKKVTTLKKGDVSLVPKDLQQANNNTVDKFTFENPPPPTPPTPPVPPTPPSPPTPPPPPPEPTALCEVCGDRNAATVAERKHMLCDKHEAVIDSILKLLAMHDDATPR